MAILGVGLLATWYLGQAGAADAAYAALCLWAAILVMYYRRWLFAVVLVLCADYEAPGAFLAFPFAGYAIGRLGIRRLRLVGLVAAGIAALTWLPFLPYGGVADYLWNFVTTRKRRYRAPASAPGNPGVPRRGRSRRVPSCSTT